MATLPREVRLKVLPLTEEAFRPFGEIIAPQTYNAPPADVDLDLSQGRPRFYMMTIKERGVSFDRITQHRKVTQCLASADGSGWYIGVAAGRDGEDGGPEPRIEDVHAFAVPGQVAVKLHRGTWHAGPYFKAPEMAFFNLELADTNIDDHRTIMLGGGEHTTIVLEV